MEINNISEFDQMRSQMALLKEKLDSQQFINGRLLREITKAKAGSIKQEALWSVVAAATVIVLMPTAFRSMGFSWAFCIVTILFMLVCIGATIYDHRDINSRTMNSDLLTVAKVMRRLKKYYRDWLKFSIPTVILWFAWLGYEVYQMILDKTLALSVILGGVVGGLIGGFFGVRSYKKVLRTCDEIISSIESE